MDRRVAGRHGLGGAHGSPPQPAQQQLPSPGGDVGDAYLLRLTRGVHAEEIKVCIWKNTDDGYKWEGYGSRRLTDGSTHRKAYYRCLNSRPPTLCGAKKVLQEHPQDSRVVVATYKGRHNHMPLKNVAQLHPVLKVLDLPYDEGIRFSDPDSAQSRLLPMEFINYLHTHAMRQQHPHSPPVRRMGEPSYHRPIDALRTRTEPLEILARAGLAAHGDWAMVARPNEGRRRAASPGLERRQRQFQGGNEGEGEGEGGDARAFLSPEQEADPDPDPEPEPRALPYVQSLPLPPRLPAAINTQAAMARDNIFLRAGNPPALPPSFPWARAKQAPKQGSPRPPVPSPSFPVAAAAVSLPEAGAPKKRQRRSMDLEMLLNQPAVSRPKHVHRPPSDQSPLRASVPVHSLLAVAAQGAVPVDQPQLQPQMQPQAQVPQGVQEEGQEGDRQGDDGQRQAGGASGLPSIGSLLSKQ